MSGGPNQLAKTKEIYEAVINKVCLHLQEDQENDSEMAVEVIDRFKEIYHNQLWKRKIEERQVYLWNERDSSSTQNNESLKKESQSANQSRFNGNSLQMNQGKNELSADKAQELLNQVNSMSQKEPFSKINHPNPNLDVQGMPIKKIKTEDHFPIQGYVKLEDNASSFVVDDTAASTTAVKANSQLNALAYLPTDQRIQTELLKGPSTEPHLPVNLKIEDSEIQDIDFLAILNQDKLGEHPQDEEVQERHTEHHVQENQQENKNEQFLLDPEYHSEQHMYGYYSIMKKKTAKKFKISFESIIASLGGKDYLMSTLSGDLEW